VARRRDKELREEKSWGISGKPHDDDGFAALAQLESADDPVQVHHSRAILEQSPHGGLEPLEIDRLCQVGVEAGFLGALDIFLHAKTGERDGWRLPGFSYLPDEVDAVAIGQTQVAEKKIEILSPDGFERGGDIWGDLCREATVFQQSRQGARGVAVIFHK
jgi:hypothetical protein